MILDGRALADELRADLRARTVALRGCGCQARLVVVIVGEDAASVAYLRSLVKSGTGVGVGVTTGTTPPPPPPEVLPPPPPQAAIVAAAAASAKPNTKFCTRTL